MIQRIINPVGNFLLKQKAKGKAGRERKAYNFNDAKSFGLIYDATNRDSYQSILKYIQYFKEERKKVVSIGFINSKDKSQFLSDTQNEHYLTLPNLNFLGFPKDDEVSKFIAEPFDVLIDLSVEEMMPLKYIYALSNARFKVSGALDYQREYGDLTIDISKDPKAEFLIIQVKHYLGQVNNKKMSETYVG